MFVWLTPCLSAAILTVDPVATIASQWPDRGEDRAPAPAPAVVEQPVVAAAAPLKKRVKRTCSSKCRKARARRAEPLPEVDPQRLAAEARRDRLLEVGDMMTAAGRPAEAARFLRAAAESTQDPVLFIGAAESDLAGAPELPALDAAIDALAEAERLIAGPSDLHLAPDAALKLLDHGNQLADYARQRSQQLRLHRRGRAELVTGGVFVALGFVGVGLLTSGAVLAARVGDRQASDLGDDPQYTESLGALQRSADARLAAGLVTGLAGAALGIPLAVLGARDLKRSRGPEAERPIFRISPGFAQITISGRF